jgi:hypothetical protein
MILNTVMLELLTDCHGIHLSCTQICWGHHAYICNIYLMMYISDLNAVSTKPRQGVARVWIFPLCLTAWLWVFCRLAEICSLSYEDFCDWRYCSYLCRPLLNIWGFVCECVYVYSQLHICVRTHTSTYANLYKNVGLRMHMCVNLCVCACYVCIYFLS